MALRKIDLPATRASMSLSWQTWAMLLSEKKQVAILRGARVDEAKIADSETEEYGQYIILGPQHTPKSRKQPKSVAIPLATGEQEPDIVGDYVRYGEIEEIDGVLTVIKPKLNVLTRSFRTGGLHLGGGTQQFRQWVRRQQLQPHQYVHNAFPLEAGTSLMFAEGQSEELTNMAELMYDVPDGNLFKNSTVPFIREKGFRYPEIGNRELGAGVLEGNFGLLLLHQQRGNDVELWDATGDPELERKYRLYVEIDAEIARDRAKAERGSKEGLKPAPSTTIRPPAGHDEER